MALRWKDNFDAKTLQRGQAYARQGLVLDLQETSQGELEARVSNGRGQSYRLHATLRRGFVDGMCSCPVGHNCKHVVAALTMWEARQKRSEPDAHAKNAQVSHPVQSWLTSLTRGSQSAPAGVDRPVEYPKSVKDRLLYVLHGDGPAFKLDMYKGRINAAGTGFNKSIRRYDALHALRSAAPAQFFRPEDLSLLPILAQSGLWDTFQAYTWPDLLRPSGGNLLAVIERISATGRLLHTNAPDAQLSWSDARPAPRLTWQLSETGSQRLALGLDDERSVILRTVPGATLWVDTEEGEIGATEHDLPEDLLRLVHTSPDVTPQEGVAMADKLPEMLGPLALPRPHAVKQIRRAPRNRVARLTLGAAIARNGPYRWADSHLLPTLTLRFAYDGCDVTADDVDDLCFVEDGKIVTLSRDRTWEETCTARLLDSGAWPVDDLDHLWPSDALFACDFVFETGATLQDDALNFAFRELPRLRADGWEVTETDRWPYKLAETRPVLSVVTEKPLRLSSEDSFQGNDWFSLGFQAEIDGQSVDVAPLVAAFLAQKQASWDTPPDLPTLTKTLADQPIYLRHGKQGHLALDLSPLAPFLHLVLTQYAELGALHPVDAPLARLAEEALAGSDVRFADHAGILPLAYSLQALAATDALLPPPGLSATLRPYQAHGAAWMGSLLQAGFGAVLADDMGLGKTIQTLALLLARRAAGAQGPALIVMPTSLLHGWQTQAAQFAPDLSVTALHGPDRAQKRDAALAGDLVLTTYPLLARDKDWLASQAWPLVILDEAQTLKNPASQMAKTLRDIPADGRIALTGTPLENSLQDLWALIDWVNPGLLGNRKTFQTQFRTPIEKQGDSAAQARLNRRLRPFLLRRTKEEVAGELPPKTEIIDRVELPKAQQALYETVRSAMDTRVRQAVAARGLTAARITVLDALLKLRQVCCDPGLVKTSAARQVTESAKRTRLRSLLTELVAEGRRVLVFSQFVEMLRLIETDLTADHVPFISLTGQTKDRAGVLDAFTQGEAPVFLLSLKAGGVGLNLTEADTVILYDPWWNPAVERQAMDRTHRIGQDKPVFVHRLVAAGTVEEKILDMQARKQALADALFEQNAETQGELLDEATLHDLFSPITM